MTDPKDPHYGHATAPRGLVILAVSGMVLISLGTVLGAMGIFLLGLLLFCGCFAPLLLAPEPERVPVAEPSTSPCGSAAPRGLPLGAGGVGALGRH